MLSVLHWSKSSFAGVVACKDVTTDPHAAYQSTDATIVNWGDGTVETVPANTLKEHTYTIPGVVQVAIAKSGGFLGNVDLSVKSSASSAVDAGWCSIRCTSSAMFTWKWKPNSLLKLLQTVTRTAFNNIGTNYGSGPNPETVIVDSLGAGASHAGSFLDSNTGVKHVVLGQMPKPTAFNNGFTGTTSLETVEGDLDNITDANACFQNSGIRVFKHSMRNLRLGSNMFRSCHNLETLEVYNTENTTGIGVYDCPKLVGINQFDMPQATSLSNFCDSCPSLVHHPGLLRTSKVTTIVGLMANCPELRTIGPIDCSGVTVANGPWPLQNSTKLESFTLNGLRVSQWLGSNTGVTTAGWKAFLAALGTAVTGAGVTLPTNAATAALTGSTELADAIAKGWTVHR